MHLEMLVIVYYTFVGIVAYENIWSTLQNMNILMLRVANVTVCVGFWLIGNSASMSEIISCTDKTPKARLGAKVVVLE
eukprot:4547814-Amphidinium_carterae.1